MVDMRVSKTRAGNGMRVRISPPAHWIKRVRLSARSFSEGETPFLPTTQ